MANITNLKTYLTELGKKFKEKISPTHSWTFDPQKFSDAVNLTYKRGYDSFYDEFWDGYQKNNGRTNYNLAFCQWGWNSNNFHPKFNIVCNASSHPNAADQMCYWAQMTDFVSREDDNGNRKDISVIINDNNPTSGYSGFQKVFLGCWKLRRIPMLDVSNYSSTFSNWFSSCYSLREIRFIQNSIKNNIDFHYSDLNLESLISVASGLRTMTATNKRTISLNQTEYALIHDNIMPNTNQTIEAYIRAKNWNISTVYQNDQCIVFESDTEFTLKSRNGFKGWNGTLQYATSLNGSGLQWQNWTSTSTITATNFGASDINQKSTDTIYRIYLRGINNTTLGLGEGFQLTHTNSTDTNVICCYGKLYNLFQYGSSEPKINLDDSACRNLLANNVYLDINAPGKPKFEFFKNIELSPFCYSRMFNKCTGLKHAPSLSNIHTVSYCYYYMFNQCFNLEELPALPATSGIKDAYQGMFVKCSKIVLKDIQGPNDSAYTIPYNGSPDTEENNNVIMFDGISSSGTTHLDYGKPEFGWTYYTPNKVIQ